MEITAQLVNELRKKTGLGLMECKKALADTNGNIDQAIEELRKKGLAKAAKKSERTTSQGRIETYIHGEGRVGVMVEIHCETDFVAKNEQFKNFTHDIALHIAGVNPAYISPEQVPADIIAKEKEIFSEQLKNEGKPANIVDKIIEGKLAKYYEEHCLLKQPFIKDGDKTVEQYLTEQISVIGENMKIARFVRFEIGTEGRFCQ
ncbi:MAG TPA: translation elongation factor Ts [bacterium]|nr:translation elongation factor Ts [bacterium]